MLLRTFRLLVPFAVLLTTTAASALEVCVDDRAQLAYPARASFERELGFLLTRQQVHLRWGECGADGLRLTIESRREGMPRDVLGVAMRRGDVILPQFTVFVEPVIEHTQLAGWGPVGRALARVTAHEVRHFLNQSADHAPHGLMQARFDSRRLSAENSRPFLQ